MKALFLRSSVAILFCLAGSHLAMAQTANEGVQPVRVNNSLRINKANDASGMKAQPAQKPAKANTAGEAEPDRATVKQATPAPKPQPPADLKNDPAQPAPAPAAVKTKAAPAKPANAAPAKTTIGKEELK